MEAPGLAAYERRDPKRTGIYSFENDPAKLSPDYEKKFRQNKKAWKFFEEQPAYYKRLMIFRTMAGKKEETRLRRLNQLIECSANGHRVGLLTAKPEKVATKGTKVTK